MHIRKSIILAAIWLVASAGWAYRPTGWVWAQWPYWYSMDDGAWRYFEEPCSQYCVNLTSGQWQFLSGAGVGSGWNYYQWPYCYSHTANVWFYLDEGSKQYCVNLSDQRWSRLGTTPPIMIVIPGGAVAMGNSYDSLNWPGPRVEGWDSEAPVHSPAVSAFRIDKYEVSNDQAAEVFQWAYAHGRIGLFPSVLTNVSGTIANVVTNQQGMVRNLEGTGQTLYKVNWPYAQIGFTNGAFFVQGGKTNFPVVGMTWWGAQAYTRYRSEMEGLTPAVSFSPDGWSCDFARNGYRLPTEAEWEKAARGGVAGTHFPWPDDSHQATNNYLYSIDPVRANYRDARYQRDGQPHPMHPWYNETVATTPVGYYNGRQVVSNMTYRPADSGADFGKTQDMANAYGLYDMGGNVYEWCWDFLGTGWYNRAEASWPDPLGETNRASVFPPLSMDPSPYGYRVFRGGGWAPWLIFQSADPSYLRCPYRTGATASYQGFSIGFRCARSIR